MEILPYIITVKGVPKAKQRPRYDSRHHRFYTPNKTGRWEKKIRKVALREHAKQWSGCMSCVFSRPYSPTGYELNEAERWKVRSCVLGLRQDNCGAYTRIPEE